MTIQRSIRGKTCCVCSADTDYRMLIEAMSFTLHSSSVDVIVHLDEFAVWVLFGVWGYKILTCMMWLMFPEIT